MANDTHAQTRSAACAGGRDGNIGGPFFHTTLSSSCRLLRMGSRKCVNGKCQFRCKGNTYG
eukprot:8026190-Alexandrium_andersonii.AAC.1